MASKLGERLEELAAFLAHQHAVDSVEEALGHLQTEIADAMVRSRASAQQCTILLFQSAEPPSLLRFLAASADFADDSRKREISAARGLVLELLASFLKAYGDHRALTKQHVVDTYKACQQTARADPFNRVKAHALEVVVNVLKYADSRVSKDDIEPRAYVDKLFYDIKFSKATQTAKGQMLEVIGHLVEKFPQDMEDSAAPLLNWSEDALEKQFSSNAPEMMMVNGLLFALARLLVCDPERYKRDEGLRKKIYSYLLTVFATTVSGNLSRYHVTNSSEIFLAKHALMFQQESGPSGHVWFTYMKFCCLSENKTVKEHAFACSNAVFQALDAYLAGSKDDTRKKCLNKILKEVLPVVSDPAAGTTMMAFAVQCLGWLARSIYVYLGAKGYSKIEEKLKTFGETLLALDAKATAWRWPLVSQYVQCVGHFVQERRDVPLDQGYVKFVGDVLCHLMAAYPQCLWKSKVVVHKSVIVVFTALSKWTVIDSLVDRFVLHTLMLSISNVTDPDQAVIYHPDTGELVTNLLYDYEGFWLAMLRRRTKALANAPVEASTSDDVDMKEPTDAGRTLQAMLFDSTVKQVIGIIRQLNLSYQFDLQSTNNGKNATGYTPIVPRDHSIMLNLTEFTERVLGKLPRSLLHPWIPPLMQQVFVLASELPLVSSFYRIATVLVTAIDDQKDFKAMPYLDGYDSDHRARFRDDLTRFLRRVCGQARFYQDELLLTSAEFVLSAPIGLADLETLVDIVGAILKLGKSYLPAAIVAIGALERWQQHCPVKLEESVLEVVPLLAAYLDQDGLSSEDVSLVKAIGKSRPTTDPSAESDLAQLQRRILLLLGKCGGKVSLMISEPPSVANASGSMGSISSPFFRLELQLSEVPLSLAMDPIISHLGDLVANSSVRRVKASAGEGYHALVCYLCGKTMTHPHAAGKKTVFYDLWRGIFARVVRLATDPEKICRSLFEPLLFQLLRWLASNSDTFPFEYASMLDELTRSLSDPETAVRTMSARSIASLLSLALEDTAAQAKVEEIFERVFSLCRHPGAVQRSGAAASISYFLRSINDEDGAVLTKFAMPCLKNLLYAVRLCHSDAQNKTDVSRDVISKAVMKIERGICRFPQLFLKGKGKTSSRQDAAIEGGSILQQTTIWLFQQASAREVIFRRLCRQLFLSFSGLVDKSSSEWIEHYASTHGNNSVKAVLTPMSSLAHTQPDMTVEWLEQLSASIESYVWCIKLLGTKAEDIFTLGSADSRKEKMKRKHTHDTASVSERSCQQVLSWAIGRFLKHENPWEGALMPSHWIAAYASVLASLCSCIKSLMSGGGAILRDVADVDSQAFRSAVVEKLLQTLLHRDDDWATDARYFDEIEDFCAGVVVQSEEWAHQMQETVGTLLSSLSPCLADVNSSETFTYYSGTIQRLSFFGSKILSAQIVSHPVADKHATTFALVAKKAMQYGQYLPDNYTVAIAALKASAACGWKVVDIFVSPAYRQAYGPVLNDLINFIPTLAVWKRCASDLVSLSLTNDYVVTVLADVLHQVTSFKVYPAKSSEWDAFTKTLVANIKQFIKNLETVKADTQRTLSLLRVLRYFLELCQQCSEELVAAVRIGPIPDIRDALISFLKERGCSYLVKAEILQMLSLMGPTSRLVANEQQAKSPILECLMAFVFDEFPIVSTDVSRGSKDFDVFHLLFSELLGVIERSNSVAYLKIIYPSLKEDDKHLFRAEIKQMLARFSVALGGTAESGVSNSSDRVRLQLGALLDVLLDPALEVAIRKTLLEEVFTPLIECQTGDTLQRFYLMESTTKKSTIIGVLAALISTSAEVTTGGSRIGVFVAFSLVEVLYRLMDPEVVRTDINSAFLGHENGKGREFTMLVCKCASKVVTKAYGDTDELIRLACCAAYSCLLTAVSRTQKQEKFFDQILFQPALWSNILDLSHSYELPSETEKFATVPLSSLSAVSLQAQGNPKTKRNGSAALQFFTASSLSMDTDTMGASVMTAPWDIDQMTADYQNVEIELDEFNRHPCMIPLVRVLVQMKADFGTTWGERAMPGWMKKIFDVFVDSSTALNVRLFLSKVVLNVPDVFEMYASSWLPAVMETLLDATSEQKTPEFSYLLRDCCNLMLDSWKNIAISPPKATADRFINELIKLCPNRNNVIRDNNLLLITNLLAVWKDLVSIDVNLLTMYIYSDDDDGRMKSSKQFTALQIVSALLSAGQAETLTSEGEEQTIEDGILLVMKSRTTSLYTLASEVGGLYLQSSNPLQGDEFMCKLTNLIIGSYNDEDFGRFLALLRNASMHHPEMLDSMMLQRLSFVLPKSVSVDAWALLATESLTNAAANEHVAKDIYAHVQSVLGRFVAHRHPGVQQSTLRAVSSLLDQLTIPEIERLVANTSDGGLGILRYYETHELPECRGMLFNVAKKLYERDVSSQVKTRLKASLLRGLCDPDELLRKEAFEYWNNSEFMKNSCSDRLLAVFGSLYSQEFDEKWVLYATNLLVGMSKESDVFKRPLFPSALGGGEYTETSIDATWELTTQSMTPLFSVEADAFSVRQGSTQQNDNTAHTVSSQIGGSVATAMQSQLFTSNSAALTPSYSQSSGGVEALQQRPGRRRFSKQRAIAVSVKDRSNYDKKASKRHFQDQYALQKMQEEARVTRERKERQARVSIKRKYRVGEFPDIQISQQDIVDPIMALCEVHVETSTLVFGALFSSIAATPQFEQSGSIPELADRLEKTLALSKASPVYSGCIISAYFASIVRSPSLCEKMVIPAKAIGEAGLSSGKYHLSELALEEQLIQHSHLSQNPGSEESVTSWDLLHKLLSTVHKRNFLIALSMACATTDESKLALQAQLSGDLPLAIASYKKAESMLDSQLDILDSGNALATETDATRCRWQRLNCLETLNNWDTLISEITDLTKSDNDFLWKQRAPYLEQGVGHYMRSCLGLAEAKRSDGYNMVEGLRSFIEKATHDSMKHGLVQSKFPVEVCMAYLSVGDKNQARVSIENFYSSFLKVWRETSSMASSSRLERMQSLSLIVEIDEVLLRFDGDYQHSHKQEQVDIMGFIDAWRRSPPSTGEDGMVLWSQHTMVQNTIVGLLLDYGHAQGTLSDEVRSAVLGIKSNAMLQYASAAISCNILALASKMLKSYRELCNTHQLPKLSVQMVEVFVSHVLKLVDRQEHQSGKGGLNPSSIKLITRYYETATKMFDNVEIMNMMETASANDQVAMGYLEAKAFASAAEFYAINDVDESLKEEYFSRSLDMFKVSCERINATASSQGKQDEAASAAFLRCRLTFIEFLNDLLFKRKMEKLSQFADRKALVRLLAENVLGGMTAGDRECAHYFPQICDVVAPYPDIVAEFEQYVLTKVPLWTCLQWSAQLMALLNGPIGGTIVLILEKMAEKYPVALFYDFMVTCKSSLDSFKVNLHRLEILLANPVMEKFVAALRLIHHPEIRLKEGLREIAKLLEDNRTADARHKVELLWIDCFSPDRPLLGAQIGRYNRDWSRKAKRDVEKIMGKDGSKMTAKTVNSAREWIMNHFSVTPGRFGITKDMKAHLGDFAEWLEEFDHSSCSLELPGQYTASWGPPDPSTHVRILSFDSMLGVLASKQLPKRLTLHCSDEKDYTFLVKGGEDLRLDQRIEQLFGVMNQILQADPRCRDQRLSLTTYDVIPMTQEIGILEWVSGTSTLKGVIESQLQIDERCTDLKSTKRQKLELFNTTAAKAYESFLLKQRGASFSAKVVAPRSKDVVDHFAKVQAMIPGDLLRRQLLGLGSSFEAFLLVRDHFLKSLAVFNACSYVLGIGDRHLDNFLFDLSNGRVIGIDFGVSFGAGASILPVPELIPFRYTRQMDFVFQPYDGANLLAQEMQAVFAALRAKRQVVESVMNVFLHEPLLDWQQSTTTHQKALFEASEGDDRSTLQDSDVDMEDAEELTPTQASRSSKKLSASPAGATAATAWLPDVKIAIARRKLEGVSPKLLLKEELSQNPHLKQHIGKFHALVDAASSSESGTHEMAAMSSLAQAQELLAMATAPDVLGRTFQGWMPWL